MLIRSILARSVASLALFAPLAGAQTPLVQHAYLKHPASDSADFFGLSAAISGDTIAVGCVLDSSDGSGLTADPASNDKGASGSVIIYERQGSGWVQTAYLKPDISDAFDQFGASVALQGDRLVVGAKGEASASADPTDNSVQNGGAVYVFERQGGLWIQQAMLKSLAPDKNDSFGEVVALDGDTIVVGDSLSSSASTNPLDNSLLRSGAVQVFQRTGSTWNHAAFIKAPMPDAGDRFGRSVSISGNTIVIGAPFEDGSSSGVNGDQTSNASQDSGCAYVYRRIQQTWVFDAYLKSTGDAGDRFGQSVTVDGQTIAIHSPEDASASAGIDGDPFDNSATAAGAVFMFERSGGQWAPTHYFKPALVENEDRFGGGVLLQGDRLLVAMSDDSSSPGVDADPTDNSAPSSGALILFERIAGQWQQSHFIKSSNPSVGNAFFGSSVAMDGGRIVAGAIGDVSLADGINGAQLDTSGVLVGACYVFDAPIAGCGATAYGMNDFVTVGTLTSSTMPVSGLPFSIRVNRLPNQPACLLGLSLAQASIPLFGGTVLIDANGLLPSAGSLFMVPLQAGVGEFQIPVPPAAAGLTVYAQAGALDASKPGGLAVTVCP